MAGWKSLLEAAGFKNVEVGPPTDTFGGAPGEKRARNFDVKGYPFIGYK